MEALRNRRTTDESMKNQKTMITTKTGDTYTTKIKTTAAETVSTTVVATHSRHSLQEGVRMIVTPLVGTEPSETAIISPPVDVHRAVTVRNKTQSSDTAASSTSKMFAAIATNHLKALGALQDLPAKVTDTSKSLSSASCSRSANGSSESSDKKSSAKSLAVEQPPQPSAAKKPMGRHKTIIECSAGTSSSSNGNDDSRLSANHKKVSAKSLKRSDKASYGSPDSPLSKMSVMPNPVDEIDSNNLPPPKNIAALEIPTPERLLPIGTQEGVAAIAERIREGLNLPDISHLKQDSLDVSESTKDDVTPSSRTNSPRRLIKQVALEEPTAAQHGATTPMPRDDVQDLHTSILKTVQDVKPPTTTGNVGNGGTSYMPSTTATRSDSSKKPRQKMVPFAVDINAIPDIRSRYAGSWPPPPYQPPEDPDDELEEGQDGTNGFHSQNMTQPNRVVSACECVDIGGI